MSIEPMYSRFFALISLFAFAMYLLVVSDNLLTLYIGWEIMGFCSYMLIGFWYAKPSARNAAVKAFLTTRVGDVFMLLGMVGLYSATGTLNYRAALADPAVLHRLATTPSGVLGLSLAGLLGILIFHRRGRQIGAIPAARLAARRDGRPDPGFGHDPCRHDGFGRRLPGHPHLPAGVCRLGWAAR